MRRSGRGLSRQATTRLDGQRAASEVGQPNGTDLVDIAVHEIDPHQVSLITRKRFGTQLMASPPCIQEKTQSACRRCGDVGGKKRAGQLCLASDALCEQRKRTTHHSVLSSNTTAVAICELPSVNVSQSIKLRLKSPTYISRLLPCFNIVSPERKSKASERRRSQHIQVSGDQV